MDPRWPRERLKHRSGREAPGYETSLTVASLAWAPSWFSLLKPCVVQSARLLDFEYYFSGQAPKSDLTRCFDIWVIIASYRSHALLDTDVSEGASGLTSLSRYKIYDKLRNNPISFISYLLAATSIQTNRLLWDGISMPYW